MPIEKLENDGRTTPSAMIHSRKAVVLHARERVGHVSAVAGSRAWESANAVLGSGPRLRSLYLNM